MKEVTAKKKTAGRPPRLTEETTVVLSTNKATTRLRERSDRRAVVQFLVNAGGKARLKDINAHFDFETKSIVQALHYAGWVAFE